MESIGGYFSLELPFHEEYHKDAIRLNTGRNCLEYILRSRQYRKVYIPYYTCDVILEPFRKCGIAYTFYHINLDFELTTEIVLHPNEALLYTNYFGLKHAFCEKLARKYGEQLIIDNTQSFFAKHISGIDTFYTCRKFFGVADGAYLYTDAILDDYFEQDISFDRMTHLLKRIDLSVEEGYIEFKKVEESLIGQPIRRMSNLTQRIMQAIDYKKTAQKRRNNFEILHKWLGTSNLLNISMDDVMVPMVYPYLSDNNQLREVFLKNKTYIAQYWLAVLDITNKDDLERMLTNQIIALPIDQRYGKEDMMKIIKICG